MTITVKLQPGSADARTSAKGRSQEASGAPDADLSTFLSMPGYLIRRSKQISTSTFMQAAHDSGITPIQFAALAILNALPGIDQTELGEIAGLDASTTGNVLTRLERRKLLDRTGRGTRRLCTLTHRGRQLLKELEPVIAEAQKQILTPLTARERTQLLRLLSKLNGVTNHYFTSPLDRRRRKRLRAV
jgi:DNA-binding MarR family transcriptional regulator